MSEIMDLIERIASGPERRIGFGQSQEQPDRQLPILIAITHSDTSSSDLSQADGVASIVPTLTALKKQLASTKNLPWGIWGSSNIDKIISRVCETKDMKPDFIVLSADVSSLEIMQEPNIAKILRIPLSITTDALFGMASIPVDAVTVCLDNTTSVSLETIGRIGTIRSVIDKPLLLELQGAISPPLLTFIKDLGIEGLAVDTSSGNSESVSTIKELLNSIPKKDKRAEKQRPSAVIGGALSYSVTADENEELE
jgi:hypothetical protein